MNQPALTEIADDTPVAVAPTLQRSEREPPPARRSSETVTVRLGGHTFYFVVGYYDDGTVAEVFVNSGKEGTAIQGWCDALGLVLSHYIQIGGDVAFIASKLQSRNSIFEPSGAVEDAPMGIESATSPVDALGQFLEACHTRGEPKKEAPRCRNVEPLSEPSASAT